MNVQPGTAYEIVVDWGVSGLAASLGARVIDNAGATTVARRTGFAEYPAGSGIYQLAGNVAPSIGGQYTIVVDDGSVTPGHVVSDDLIVTFTAPSPTSEADFAQPDDLAARLGLTLTEEEQTRAAVLLADASGVIRDETSQTIDLVTDDTYERAGTTDARIPLPQRPVVVVASVAIDGTEISDWYLAGSELVRGTRPSVEQLADGDWAGSSYGFGSEARTLTIVYTHGYAAVPQTVRSIAIEMAVRVWVNPGSVVQETIAGTGSTYAPYSAPPRGLMLTDSERAALRRLFGRRAHSVTIGGG